MHRAKALTRVTPAPRFALIEIRRLHAHEQTGPALLRELTEQIRRDGVLKIPVLVADRDFVILDGHHRVEALRALGCKRVSVHLVDYYSDFVDLGTWPDAAVAVVTKQDVIRRGLSNDLFPPKTTRHTLASPLEERPTDLELLK